MTNKDISNRLKYPCWSKTYISRRKSSRAFCLSYGRQIDRLRGNRDTEIFMGICGFSWKNSRIVVQSLSLKNSYSFLGEKRRWKKMKKKEGNSCTFFDVGSYLAWHAAPLAILNVSWFIRDTLASDSLWLMHCFSICQTDYGWSILLNPIDYLDEGWTSKFDKSMLHLYAVAVWLRYVCHWLSKCFEFDLSINRSHESLWST